MSSLHKVTSERYKSKFSYHKSLRINARKCFPSAFCYGVVSDGYVNLFVHSWSHDRQKLCSPDNVGFLYYEVISSPFIIFNFYLDVLARIILKHCDKFVLWALISGLDLNECRNSTAFSPVNCFSLRKDKIKQIIFLHAVKLSKRLAVQSCQVVNSAYVINVFNKYKFGVEFYSPYLSIERPKNKREKDK